jgi:hypothetical protein
MRPIVMAIASAAIVLASMPGAEARSGIRPWCLMEGGSGPICLYYSFRQCYESSRGVGGTCIQNPKLGYR